MQKHINIDSTDKKILEYLIKNARTPFLEIARVCGISGAAIHQRIKKLEDLGVIAGSKFIINPRAIGMDICVFVGVHLDMAHLYKDVVKEFENISEIVECHYTTGNYAILLKMYCKDNEHLMDVLVNTIQNIKGVSKTETFISLEQAIKREICVK
ncbi:MAG: Lrp/AsnC ligand binding domain-containing protein [Bacteroidales bacterium]|jgi:Lrp/AsnC family transcriptional regulator for asnA, asnC and gidA|nr:Lrp/AsnC ligand binding domain-containing protein [Bacteroidales bacterium]